jgi:hypothetical protein
MDYFKQRREYRKLKRDQIDISTGQNNLYRELLDYANDEGKLEVAFTLKNSALVDLTGLSESGMKKARNELVQLGLIKYTVGKRNKAKPTYQIVQLYDTSWATRIQKSSSTSNPTGSSTSVPTVAQPVAHKNLLVPDSNQTIKSNSQQSRKREYADDSPEMIEAVYLWEKIKGNNPEHRKPSLQAWADDVRKMHELDHRPFEKIHKMIDWCQLDTFWQTNILSASKLRSKYDTMAAQANRKYASNRPTRTEKLPDWAQEGYKPEHKKASEEDRAKLAEQLKKLRSLGDKAQEAKA